MSIVLQTVTNPQIEAARALLGDLEYDRNRWSVVACGIPERPQDTMLFISTTKPDEATGLYSEGSGSIPRTAFESSGELTSAMQSLLKKLIAEIEALPPPTIEEAERLRACAV